MDERTGKNQTGTEKLLLVIITLLFAAIVIFAASFFAYDLSKGSRPDQITRKCEDFNDFEIVRGDERTPVSFPCNIDVPAGEELVLETKLPDTIDDDTWICYKSGKSTRIYVGDELKRDFDRTKGTIQGGTVKLVYMFTELSPNDAGKTLRIVRFAESGRTAHMYEMFIGTSLGIIEKIVRENIVFFILNIALLMISFMAIGIGLMLRFSKKIVSPITSMGIGVMFVSIWLTFDSDLYQLAFRNYYIDGTMSFLMMLLIPYPFIYYMDMLQERRYRMMYALICLYLETVTVCTCLIHFAGVTDFLTMLPFLAISEAVVVAAILYSMIRDYMTGAYKSYFASFLGVSGLLISCAMELIMVNTVQERYDGSWMIIGLFWTVTLAIVHQLNAVRQAQKEAAVAVRASETKSNFLANMSHEIRTPMNAILGMDEMIIRESRNDPKITKYASDIKSAGNMLLSIINDILDISKIESGKAELVPVDFDICSVINDLINIVSRRAGDKGIGFTVDAAQDIPVRFHGDEIRARQIILNIVNNAVKYTNEGSVRVNIDMMCEPDAERGNIKAGDIITLIITVIDSGIGIKEEDIDKLFKPFDRLEETKNRNIEGTGLGLSIASKYVELMDGHIEVESKYGKGSVFTVYMPLEVTDPTPIDDLTDRIGKLKDKEIEERSSVMAPNAAALIVDDNELNLEVISGLMERTRMRVDVALSGPEGIEKMDRRRYDIIFLDQMMPGMDGVTTLKLMRSKFDMRNVSVIALTADAVAGAREFYLEKGFDDYVSKPVKADELENVLKNNLPKQLLLSKEDIDRITAAEEQRKEEAAGLRQILVVDHDSESLRTVKEETEGIFKGTFVTDTQKALKYLEKHDPRYVMVSKDIFMKLSADKNEDEKD
ncbi:MAG: response regulator [Lachnospiraceae bacterium]|nr:response regulator [Lachnospiraceae bacterium]